MQTRIAAATYKLGGTLLAILTLMVATLPLYVTIIHGARAPVSGSSISAGDVSGSPDRTEVVADRQRTPHDEILSRRRRYLVFPRDSSLQLVFDEVITIVDYTIYVVTGQTLALAWELPHRPIALEDVLAGTAAYQSPPLSPVVEPVQQPVMTQSPPLVYASPYDQYYRRRQDSYYFGGGGGDSAAGGGWRRNGTQPFGNWQRTASPNVNGYHWSDGIDRVDGGWHQYNQYTSEATTSTTGDPNAGRDIIISDNYPFIRKRPIISLPLGKRSVPAETAYGRHHRESRYDLYRLIEKFLNSNGHNGTECILRTLCEVGQHQRSDDSRPGSFVAEIVRAIFQLPAQPPRMPPADRGHFHAAHSTERTTSCTELFPACAQSIWTASFFT